VRLILGALGKEYYVADEKLLDAATALSGSGPAYCFLVLEAMVDAGVQLGFPRRVAEQIVLQTMHGSTLLAMQSGKHLAEMRNAVTSPGGTTAAALRTLERGGLRTVLSDGVWAAYERATELGK
jgi:pyrroline-5-carboxylate reductase